MLTHTNVLTLSPTDYPSHILPLEVNQTHTALPALPASVSRRFSIISIFGSTVQNWCSSLRDQRQPVLFIDTQDRLDSIPYQCKTSSQSGIASACTLPSSTPRQPTSGTATLATTSCCLISLGSFSVSAATCDGQTLRRALSSSTGRQGTARYLRSWRTRATSLWSTLMGWSRCQRRRGWARLVSQFYAPGKEIRHVTFGEKYLAFSAELVDGTDEGLLLVYSVSGLLQGKYQPLFSLKGRYYFPEYLGDELTVLEYHDPNPKGRKRKQTVLTPKLPITNQIIKFDKNFKISFKAPIQQKGQIICCCQNKGIIYYLHTTKRLTLVDVKGQKTAEVAIPTKSFPYMVELFQNGVVFVCENNKLEYFQYDFGKKEEVGREIIEVRSMGAGGNLALKFSEDRIYSFNESGLHFYCNASKQTVSQSLFSITNCGISFNSTASMFAVADFGGTFFIFNSSSSEVVPLPLFSIFISIPIRSLVQIYQQRGGGECGGYWWVYGSEQAQQILQIDHTFNIIRAVEGKVYAGSSDGTVKIFQSLNMKYIGEYKAHHPIDYESQEERELFGSMKNYAEIWSLKIPVGKAQTFIVSSCEDQSQKVYRADPTTNQYEMIYHLKGHELAVTSVD